MISALALPLLLYVPGHLAMRAALRRARATVPIAEWVFTSVVASVLLTTGTAHALGAIGGFTPARLFATVGAIALVFAAFGGGAPLAGRIRIAAVPTILFAVLVGGLAFLYYPPSQFVYGVADEGVYLNAAVELAKHGGLWFHDPIFTTLPPIAREAHYGVLTSGFYFDFEDPTLPTVSHGFHWMPSYLAALYAIGGLPFACAGPTILMLISVVAIFVIATRVAGPWFGFVVAALLGINPISVWFSRITFAETMAEALILSASALLVLGMGVARSAPHSTTLARFWIALAGATLGALHLAKIEFVLIPGIVAAFTFYVWAVGRLDRRTIAFPLGYGVVLALAGVQAVTCHRIYFFSQLGNPEMYGDRNAVMLVLFLIVLAVVSAAVIRWRSALRRAILHRYVARLFVAIASVSVLAGVYLYFLLPLRVAWHSSPRESLNAIQAWLALPQERHPLQPDVVLWRHLTFQSLGLYLSAVGVFAGLIGSFWLITRRRLLAVVPFLVIGLVQTLFFVVISGKIDAFAAHFHSPGRRFLNVTVASFVFAAVVPWFIASRGPRWMLRGLGVAVIGVLAVHFGRASWPHIGVHCWSDSAARVHEFASALPDNVVCVAHIEDTQAVRLLSPLHFIEEKKTFLIDPRADAAKLAAALDHLTALGCAPVLIECQGANRKGRRWLRQLFPLDRAKRVAIEERLALSRRFRLPGAPDLKTRRIRFALTAYFPPGVERLRAIDARAPRIDHRGKARAGNEDFVVLCTRVPPDRDGLLYICASGSASGIDFSGARVFGDPASAIASYPVKSDAHGVATVRVPIHRDWRTQTVYLQFVFSGTHAGSPVASDALRIRVW